MSFEKFNFNRNIQKALVSKGYSIPTPIQEQAIPFILEGRDIIGCAQTGTGKTAAFALPMLQLLDAGKTPRKFRKNIRALVVAPTRELAQQVSDSFRIYGDNSGIRNTVIYGGVSQRNQTEKLRKGVDILIATPGRLLDLMQQKHINLDHVEILVLDEADRMFDMGFINDIRKIIAAVPEKRQTLFFSATMPPQIIQLTKDILKDPVKISITPEQPAVEAIKQELYYVSRSNKKKLLLHILKNTQVSSALVFTRTKHAADMVTRHLNTANINSEAIHSNKSQNSRQRALDNFKSKQTRVLVATDIASRGLDIQKLSHVINYDLPDESETYIHRIGRTGRAGLGGTAVSFCEQEEKLHLRDINRLIKTPIPVIYDHPFISSPDEEYLDMVLEKSQKRNSNNRQKNNNFQKNRSNFGRKNRSRKAV